MVTSISDNGYGYINKTVLKYTLAQSIKSRMTLSCSSRTAGVRQANPLSWNPEAAVNRFPYLIKRCKI